MIRAPGTTNCAGGQGNSWPMVSRIDAAAAAAAVVLDFKAALGLAIPNNPMATYTTIDRGSGGCDWFELLGSNIVQGMEQLLAADW